MLHRLGLANPGRDEGVPGPPEVAGSGDDSVRRLKGAGRPVNAFEDRAAVLAALEAVDAVAPDRGPFLQDRPE